MAQLYLLKLGEDAIEFHTQNGSMKSNLYYAIIEMLKMKSWTYQKKYIVAGQVENYFN